MMYELDREIMLAQIRGEWNLVELLKEFVLPEKVEPMDVEFYDPDR